MLMFGHFWGKAIVIQNTKMGMQDEGLGHNFEESKHLIEKGFKMLEGII